MSKITIEGVSFENNQKNEAFLFNKNQQKEKILYELSTNFAKEHPSKYTPYKIEKYLYEYITFLMEENFLTFTFGKYKDIYVDIILEEDKDYCQWFVDNIRGTDFNTLKILDYLNKKINGRTTEQQKYYFKRFDEVWFEVIKIVPECWKSYVQDLYKQFKEKFSYLQSKSKRSSYYSKDELDVGGYDDDYCNEFCYYGDCVVDYGDLC